MYDPDRLVSENLNLARFFALQFADRGVDYDDLESEANVMLWRAALAYDPAKGDFAAYARRWIIGGLIDLTGNAPSSAIAGISVRLRRSARKLRRAAADLLSEGVNQPTIEQLAERTGLDPIEARKAWSLPEVRADQRLVERLIDAEGLDDPDGDAGRAGGLSASGAGA